MQFEFIVHRMTKTDSTQRVTVEADTVHAAWQKLFSEIDFEHVYRVTCYTEGSRFITLGGD